MNFVAVQAPRSYLPPKKVPCSTSKPVNWMSTLDVDEMNNSMNRIGLIRSKGWENNGSCIYNTLGLPD
jgi:hypothetical protein